MACVKIVIKGQKWELLYVDQYIKDRHLNIIYKRLRKGEKNVSCH